MEKQIIIHIEKLPEGVYLATSDMLQGLIAQGRTVNETIDIAKDVAKKLMESRDDKFNDFENVSDSFEYPLVVGV